MPTPTYDLIEEKILGSASATVTFNSIPGTYKDLVLEVTTTNTPSASHLQVGNGSVDTGSNYSRTQLLGDGTNATSGRVPNETKIFVTLTSGAGTWLTSHVHFFSYANTNVSKTVITRYSDSASYAAAIVSLWRSTSAINVITLLNNSGNYPTGSTFRLWGVAG